MYSFFYELYNVGRYFELSIKIPYQYAGLRTLQVWICLNNTVHTPHRNIAMRFPQTQHVNNSIEFSKPVDNSIEFFKSVDSSIEIV